MWHEWDNMIVMLTGSSALSRHDAASRVAFEKIDQKENTVLLVELDRRTQRILFFHR